MLNEVINNLQINKNYSFEDARAEIFQDFDFEVLKICNVDLAKNFSVEDFEKILYLAKEIIFKISASNVANSEQKNFICNMIMTRIFELTFNSSDAENFFILIRKIFSAARIVSALDFCLKTAEQYQFITKFFTDHKKIFPTEKKKIKTVGIYYTKIFSGGTERFVSSVIPYYLEKNYRVVLFTNFVKPELEYKLPNFSEKFERVNLNGNYANFFEYLNEFEKNLSGVDIIVSNVLGGNFSIIWQIIFAKLLGKKFVAEIHQGINYPNFYPQLFHIYQLSDAMIVLSRKRAELLQKNSIRAYFIPNPISEKNFFRRNTENVTNTILWAGRVSNAEDKNAPAVLPIMREVVKKIPTAKLKIVGELVDKKIFDSMQKFISLPRLSSLDNSSLKKFLQIIFFKF